MKAQSNDAQVVTMLYKPFPLVSSCITCIVCTLLGVSVSASNLRNPIVKISAFTTSTSTSFFGLRMTDRTDEPNVDIKNISSSNTNIYEVPATAVEVVLECNASYPVMWSLIDSDINPEIFENIRVRSYRYVEDLFDHTTFNYSTRLTLLGYSTPHKLTGNYSCQSTFNSRVRTDVFFYWNAADSTSLVYSRQKVIIYYDESQPLVLPCGLSDSSPLLNRRPRLTKQGSKGQSITITQNKTVQYSHTGGFTLKVPYPLGKYVCVEDWNQDDVPDKVTILVKKRPGVTLKSNATFETKGSELSCCSSSSRPPMIFLMFCDHAVACQYREHTFQPFHYVFSRNVRKGNCATSRMFFRANLLARCVGDGIDQYKEIVNPLRPSQVFGDNTQNRQYSNWEDMDPHSMMDISLRSKDRDLSTPSSTLYHKQPVSAQCSTSNYYFSEGTYWAIRWQNSTLTPIMDENVHFGPVNKSRREHHMLFQRTNKLEYTLDTSMNALICFAPIWNSSLWVSKTTFLYVNETKRPIMIQNKAMEQSWYINETSKNLTCSASGAPSPSLTWKHESMVIDTENVDFNITSVKANNSDVVNSTLTIHRVSHSTRGAFICSATNFGGTVTKSFNVIVVDKTSWKAGSIIISVTIILCLLGVAMFCLWRRIRGDQTTIQHLATVRFKGVTVREEADTADTGNSELDSRKGFAQLIN